MFAWDMKNPERPIADKDPNAVFDYPLDFTAFLTSFGDIPDTYASHDIIINAGGIVEGTSTQSGGVIYQFISGGFAGETCSFTCRLVTTGGRTEDKTYYLRIREK
jgi:hypothetical protein